MWALALEHWRSIEVIEYYVYSHAVIKRWIVQCGYLPVIFIRCLVLNFQLTIINKIIIQITDTTSKTDKTAITTTLMLMPSVSLLWQFSFPVSCGDSTVTQQITNSQY